MKTSKTKKRFLLSLIAVVACLAMLIGTTFAWFTDSVSNTGNKIQAGTLKVGLEQYKKAPAEAQPEWKDIAGSTNPVFASGEGTGALWEPGYSQYAVVRLSNKGNLAFKYKLLLKVNGTLAENAEGHTLADAIEVYGFTTNDEAAATAAYGKASFDEFQQLTGVQDLGSLKSFLFDGDGAAYGILLPNGASKENVKAEDKDLTEVENVYAVLALHMKEEAGNEYQGMDIGTTFDITAQATQYTFEKDGFGSWDYDALAKGNPDHPEFDVPSAPVVEKKDILPIKKVDQNTTKISEEIVVQTTGMKVAYPEGVLMNEGHESSKDVGEQDYANAKQGFEYVSSAPSSGSVVVNDSQAVKQFELTLDAVSQDNTVLLTIKRNIGAGLEGLELYHNGTKLPAANGETFTYNKATGELELKVYHASPIDAVYYTKEPTPPDGAVAHIGYDFYNDAQEAINQAKAGDTVKIVNDFTVPVTGVSYWGYKYSGLAIEGKNNITIDFNGKRIVGSIIVGGHISSSVDPSTPSGQRASYEKTTPSTGIVFTDSSKKGDGGLSYGDTSGDSGTITVYDDSSLTVNGGKYECTYAGLRKSDGSIANSGQGYVVYLRGGNLTVNNGNFVNNASVGRSNHVMDMWEYTPATITVNGGNFKTSETAGKSYSYIFYSGSNSSKVLTINLNGGTYTTTDPNYGTIADFYGTANWKKSACKFNSKRTFSANVIVREIN